MRNALLVLVLVVLSLSGCEGSSSATPPTPRPPSPSDPIVAPSTVGEVAVYPLANSRTALPATSIAFRGVTPMALGPFSVTGSVSGPHAGTIKGDSDGQGADFYPTEPFVSGEKVTVGTSQPLVSGGSTFSFTIATPVSDPVTHRQEKDDPAQDQHFVSAPDLTPPQLTTTHGALSASGGSIFLGPKGGPGQDGPMISDRFGRLQWFKPLPDGLQPFNVRAQRYLGKPVVTWWQGRLTQGGHGQGVDEIYDDHYQPVATVHAGNGLLADHHDFTISSDNTALITAYQAMRWDTRSVGGTKDGVAVDGIVQEIDIPTGNVLFEWHALDHVRLADSYRAYDPLWDYFHVNSIQSLPDGQLLIGAKCTHQAYEIDKATGHIVWRLGGKQSDFTGNGNVFSSQHHIRLHGGDLLTIFDNATSIGPTVEPYSRVMAVRLDFTRHTAIVTRSIRSNEFQYAKNQGSVQIEQNGNYFVGWGAQPWVSEYGVKGRLRWQARLPGGDTSYRAFRSGWHAVAPGRPAIAVARSGASVAVHTSWNGATEVTSYGLLAGPSPTQLHRVVTVPATGFETDAVVAGRYRYLATQALNASGTVLATSETRKVTA